GMAAMNHHSAAEVMLGIGRYDAALVQCRKALHIAEASGDEQPLDTLQTMAAAYRGQGKDGHALDCYHKVVVLDLLGAYGQGEAEMSVDLGQTRPEGCESLPDAAPGGFVDPLSQMAPLANTLNNLGRTHRLQRDYERAEARITAAFRTYTLLLDDKGV